MDSLVRSIFKAVEQDLKEKMVFIGGPRQVGKTTLALSLLKNADLNHPAYLNWDDLNDRKKIKLAEIPENQSLIIFDEIHKYKNWRTVIKGLYDKKKHTHQFIVTGSARLDYYRKGGDSLLGRYHYFRLHPYSVNEVKASNKNDLEHLLHFGGFPEPFHKATYQFLKRWRNERLQKIIYEDIRDLERVQEISLMESLLDLITPCVGSTLSMQSLSNQLEINIKTVQRWIDIFDQLYLTFRVKPYTYGKLKLVKRTENIYFYDWTQLPDSGAQFENFVASHLLKYCHFTEDTEGDKMELRYLKDVEGREIDFVVLKNKKPYFAVECKVGERSTSSHIHYFRDRTPIPYYYQVHLGTKHTKPEKNVEIIPFLEFCKKIGVP